MKKFLQFWLIFLCVTVVWPSRGTAEDKSFMVNGIATVLPEATAEAQIFYQAMRLNRASNIWNVEVVIRNNGSNDLRSPLVVYIPTFSGTTGLLQPDGMTEGKPFYDLSQWVTNGTLAPGERSAPRNLSIGFSSGETPVIEARVYGRSAQFALALTHTLNGEGQPLGNVQVEETGPAGTRNLTSDARWGIITLGNGSGPHWWKFQKFGYLPVWRSEQLSVGSVSLVHNPRLILRSTNAWQVSSGQAGDITNGVAIAFPTGSGSGDATAILTMLNGQTVPALLPMGWSPLQAFSLELSAPLSASANATVKLWDNLLELENAAVVRWNEATLKWDVLQTLSGNGTNTASFSVPGGGTFLVITGDSGDSQPAAPQVGSVLTASSVEFTNYSSISAGGRVTPATSPASVIPELVTAEAQITFTNTTGHIPSGIILRGEVSEKYLLRDGTSRVTPSYDKSVIGYQRPRSGTSGTVTALTPLRPLFLFGADELLEATVTMNLFEPTAFEGQVFEPLGSQIVTGNLRIISDAQAYTNVQAALLRTLNPTNYLSLSSNIVFGFHLDVKQVEPGTRLQVDFATNTPNSFFVLARVVAEKGVVGLEPIERFASTGSGVLVSGEPDSGERLPGLTGSGEYLLIKVPSAQALVSGSARNSAGELEAGILVRLSQWVTFSKADGSYQLLAPVGPATVEFAQRHTGDNAFEAIQITSPLENYTVDGTTQPSGPRVTAVSPASGALNVPRVTPVVLAFSKPINPGSLASGSIQLLDTNGQPVAASVSLNLRNTLGTLLPVAQLAASAQHTIFISTNLVGQNGLPLEGVRTFTFTTETDAIERVGAQLVSHEPENGKARMEGSPGTADPESPVVLVNETTGQTATVLSRPDGSFSNFIKASVDDFLSAVIVNQNGTRTTLPVSRQLFRDGSVGLFNGGGILEAQSDGGAVEVLVEPGAISGKTRFQFKPIPISTVLDLLKGTQPEGGRLIGGFSLEESGDEARNSLDVSFAVNPAALGLPEGVAPEDATYALTVPHEFEGTVVYEIIDSMEYEDGKLVTHSPPFPGLKLRELIRQVASTRRGVDAFQSKVAETVHSLESGVGLMFAPTTVAPGHPITLQGRVVAIKVNEQGTAIGSEQPVEGAVVSVTRNDGALRVPGHLRPGQFIAISDADGFFALRVPADLPNDPTGYELHASHPRFPLQRATVTLAREGGTEVSFARFKLKFPYLDLSSIQLPDTLAPKIHVTLDVLNPRIGTNLGAVVKITAIDDRALPVISVKTNQAIPLYTGTNITNTVLYTELTENVVAATTKEKLVKVSVSHKSKVPLTIQATDSEGNIKELIHEVTFSNDEFQRPAPTQGDTIGPRVISAWPPEGARGIRPGDQIILRFSEAVKVGSASKVLSFSTQHESKTAILSPDGREVRISFGGRQDGDVQYAVNSGEIHDYAGNPLQTSFSLKFVLATPLVVDLPEIVSGGGIVQKGAFAYALERNPREERGKLITLDVQDPANPRKVGEVTLPSYPRDLCLIPNWIYTTTTNATDCVTNDLLAIVGGKVGAPTSDEGTFYQGQYLVVVNISDPTKPEILSKGRTVLTYSLAAVSKVRWAAPHLAYLEAGGDASAVGVVNLQAFLIGQYASEEDREKFPLLGLDGLDADGDGSFCQTNDVLCLPARRPAEFYGKEFSFTGPVIEDANRTQVVLDFDFESSYGLLGMIFQGEDGSTPPLTPKYQTIYSASGLLDHDLSTFEFPQTNILRRMMLLPDARLLPPGSGEIITRNLALVAQEGNRTSKCDEAIVVPSGSVVEINGKLNIDCPYEVYGTVLVHPSSTLTVSNRFDIKEGGIVTNRGTMYSELFSNGGTLEGSQPITIQAPPKVERSEQLYVIDITDPLSPTNLNILNFPKNTGPAGLDVGRVLSMDRRADGSIALATEHLVVLLDPARLLSAQSTDSKSWPAAMLGVIPGAGSGARSFEANTTGQNLVSLGGKHQIIKTPPYLDIVSFGDTNGINIIDLSTTNDVVKDAVFRKMTSPSLLLKTRYAFGGGGGALLSVPPPHPYYVRVDLSGRAGQEVELVVESLDSGGVPLSPHATNGVPVRLGSSSTLAAVNDTNTTPYRTSVKARRMSDDERSDYYNRYLSGPIILTSQTLTPAQRSSVFGSGAMVPSFLRPGKYLWAGFDRTMAGNQIMGEYASGVSAERIIPGTYVRKVVEKERAPLIFIPGMAASRLMDVLDFPTSDPGILWAGSLMNPTFLGLSNLQFIAESQLNFEIGTERWPGLFVPRKERLSLSPYDRRLYSGQSLPMYPYDVLRYIPEVDCGLVGNLFPTVASIYGPILDRLKKEEGYVEYLHTNAIFAAYKFYISSQNHCQSQNPYFNAALPTLFVYPFDWRRDNTNAANGLTNLINKIREFHPEAEKVDLLAHSMGGLVARRFALDHPDLVDKVITAGTPWLGTPKAINVMQTGDFGLETVIIDKPTLQRMAEYYPAAHQLLPSVNYFRFGQQNYPLAEAGYDLDGNGATYDVLDYDQYKRMMDSRCHCDPASRPISNAGEPYHTYQNSVGSQDDWSGDNSPTRYYHLYGVQRAPMTITRMVAAGRIFNVTQTNNNLRMDLPEKFRKEADARALHPLTQWVTATNYWIIRPQYLTERGLGDQTVAEVSLSRRSGGLDLNKPSARVVPFYSTNVNDDSQMEHTGILGTRRIQNAIIDALADIEPVGDPAPGGTQEVLSIRVTELTPDSPKVTNRHGESSATPVESSALAQALEFVAPKALALVQTLYQAFQTNPQIAVHNRVNSILKKLTGVDSIWLEPKVMEFTVVADGENKIKFDTTGQPVSIRAVRLNGGSANHLWSWPTLALPRGTEVEIAFQDRNFQQLRDENGTLHAPSNDRPLSGTVDYQPPTLTTNYVVSGDTTNIVFGYSDNETITQTNLLVFIAQDLDGDNSPLDDKWLPLTNLPPSINATNVIGKTLFAVLQDDSGNLSQPLKLTITGSDEGDQCRLFDAEREGVRRIIQAGFSVATNQGWLLDPAHASILEQGSGACLWAPNHCNSCKGVYTPGKSDHDFELFLPVELPLGSLQLNVANAFLPTSLEGNWYHKGPVATNMGPNGPVYEYELPPGHNPPAAQNGRLVWGGMPAAGSYPAIPSTSNPSEPPTPAKIISQLLDRERQLPTYISILPDVSFFPERREHFESGIVHLNRPPNEGDDPIGDAGLGRQMLLLKWLLEGRYVPGYAGEDLAVIYERMSQQAFPSLNGESQNGFPAAEGYEWGLLQEHTVLKSGILLRVEDMNDPAEPNPKAKNFLYDTFVGQVKKAGKGAIRSTLAAIVGRAGSSVTNLFIPLTSYNYPAFEDYIADMAATRFSQYFSPTEQILIQQSALAKVANENFVTNLLADPCLANTYLADAYKFVQNVQALTKPSYDRYMQFIETNGVAGGAEQFVARLSNTNWLVTQVTNPPSLAFLRTNAALDVVLRIFNEGSDTLTNVDYRMYIDGVPHASYTNNLAPYQVFYKQGNHHEKPGKQKSPFYIEEAVSPANFNIPHVVDLVVSAPGIPLSPGSNAPGGATSPYLTDWEPQPCDNWIRFRYYLFDVDNPCPVLTHRLIHPPPNLDCTTSDLCPDKRNQR